MTLRIIAPSGIDFSANAVRQVLMTSLPDFGPGLTRLHLLRDNLSTASFNEAGGNAAPFDAPFDPITFDAQRAAAATRRDRIDDPSFVWGWDSGFTFALTTRGPVDSDEAVFLASEQNQFNVRGLFFRIASARRIRLQVAVDAGLGETQIERASGFFPQANDVMIFGRFDPVAGTVAVYTPDNNELESSPLGVGPLGEGSTQTVSNTAMRLLGDGSNTASRESSASSFWFWDRPLTQAEMLAVYQNAVPWMADRGVTLR